MTGGAAAVRNLAPCPANSTQLGRRVPIPASPDKAKLEAVANAHSGSDYVVRFTAPEFTCLCPITGQPDFAHFVIDYCPSKSLVESKSLKLYLASFRNHAAFHEDTTLDIGKRLAAAIKPKYLRIAVIGFRAAACRSTCSGRRENYPPGYGCPIRRLALSRTWIAISIGRISARA